MSAKYIHSALFAILLVFPILALFPSNSRFGSRFSSMQRQQRLEAQKPERPTFGSRLMTDISEDELQELFNEFNITNFELNKDTELTKWAPSKELFEKYGFQNKTERYKRKTMDVKISFYSAYTRPILPQYKTFIADIMALTHIQTVDSRYEYDALHAFGICTQYYTIMKGYPLQEEIDVIFNEMMKAVLLDPVVIRDDAKRMLMLIKSVNGTEEDFLNMKEGELAKIFDGIRNNRFFKYTDAWGVGLGRLMELVGVDPKPEAFEKWEKNLKWVSASRLSSSWEEFCADQVKMQGVEAMQKQLLIREKKRAAQRLEKKAADFEDKKKALQELNEAIEERRAQLIEEQKALKLKYEPDEYQKILLEESKSKAETSV
jgi:hypothetical protein